MTLPSRNLQRLPVCSGQSSTFSAEAKARTPPSASQPGRPPTDLKPLSLSPVRLLTSLSLAGHSFLKAIEAVPSVPFFSSQSHFCLQEIGSNGTFSRTFSFDVAHAGAGAHMPPPTHTSMSK